MQVVGVVVAFNRGVETGSPASPLAWEPPTVIRAAGSHVVESYINFFQRLHAEGLTTGPMHRTASNSFFDWCDRAGVSFGEIRPEHVEAWVQVRSRSWRNSTVYAYFSALRQLFEHFVAADVLSASPFRNLEIPSTLADLRQFIIDIDHTLPDSDDFSAAQVVCFPVVLGGFDLDHIAVVTGVSLEDVQTYASRLRCNGIWTDDGKVCVESELTDGMGLAVEFLLHILVAQGKVRRVPKEPQPAGCTTKKEL